MGSKVLDEDMERRRKKRSILDNLYTGVEIGGRTLRARIMDLSEDGMKIALPPGVKAIPEETIRITIDNVAPVIKSRVRWVSTDEKNPQQAYMGIQFETVIIDSLDADLVSKKIDLPIDPGTSGGEYGHILQRIEEIEEKIVDGKIDDLSQAVGEISNWIEGAFGPLNVWRLIPAPDGSLGAELMLDRGHGSKKNLPARMAQVLKCGETARNILQGEASCIWGGSIVLEVFSSLADRESLVQRIALLFGGRVNTWSKLIIKNIALKFISDELDHRIRERTHQLELAAQLANEASHAKSNFLSNISHELRNPLNAIMGFAQALEKEYFGELNSKQAEYIRDIRSSGQHLLNLIGDILDIAKVEEGQLEFNPAPVDIADLMESMVRAVQEPANAKNITLRLKTPTGLAEPIIMADERLLKQVLYNLLSNAVKFTGEKGWIELAAEQAGDSLRISVRDNGIGLSPEDREKVFERFYQVRSSITDKTPGTGLGLPLCRFFVKLHGGEIWAESKGVGKGSLFQFTILLRASRPGENGPSNGSS